MDDREAPPPIDASVVLTGVVNLSSSSGGGDSFIRISGPEDSGDFWALFFGWFIAISYALLCLLAAVQLTRTICYRHKTASFRFGFLLLCFAWTTIRLFFWFFVDVITWPIWLSHLIYFLPTSFQMITFTLVILFYAKLAHKYRWRALRRTYVVVAVTGNLAYVCAVVASAALLDIYYAESQQQQEEYYYASTKLTTDEKIMRAYQTTTAAFFAALVIIAVVFVRYLHKTRASQANIGSGGVQGTTTMQEVFVTSWIFIILLSRCVYDMCAAYVIDKDSVYRLHINTKKVSFVFVID